MAKSANQSCIFEFDDAEVWFNSDNPTPFEPAAKKMVVPASSQSFNSRIDRKRTSFLTAEITCATSLPVNIPDWSKIYKGSYAAFVLDCDHDQESVQDKGAGGGRDDEEGRIPPHELLARRRGASFSVHEGIGRTLKGRDLKQVRNTIWKKVGFED